MDFMHSKDFKQKDGKSQYKASGITSKLANLSSIASVLKGFGDAWAVYSKKSTVERKSQMDAAMTNAFSSEKELDNFVPWDTVEAKRLKMVEAKTLANTYTKIKNAPAKKALAGFYTLLYGPRRVQASQYLTAMPKNKKQDPNLNYIDIDEGKIILNRYKTKWKFGTQILDVPQKLLDLLKALKTPPGQPVWPQRNGNYYKTFGGQIKAAFKAAGLKNVGVNVLRHSRISKLLAVQNVSNAMKLRLATAMGHSVAVQSTYNRITDKDLAEAEENFEREDEEEEEKKEDEPAVPAPKKKTAKEKTVKKTEPTRRSNRKK